MEFTPEMREVMKQIGQRTSEKKKAAQRANALKGAESRRGTSVCNCDRNGEEPLSHRSKCPVYRAAIQRQNRARKKIKNLSQTS